MRVCLIALFAYFAVVPGAHAVFRCENQSVISYSDTPCKSGRSVDIGDRVRDRVAPADAEESKQRLARQQQYIGLTSAAQAKELQAAERAQKKERELKASREKKCADLALRRKWAQEDAEVASVKTRPAAQRKAVRADERYALSCKT